MQTDSTFLDALTQTGGPTKDARSGRIHLVRPSDGLERDFALSEFMQPGHTPNVELENGDIIYVPGSFISKVGYLLEKLSPAISYALFGRALVN